MLYVRQREDREYFKDPLGVQIVGKARLLTGSDPEFEDAMKIYLPTLSTFQSKEGKEMMNNMDKLIQKLAAKGISTKVVPERIVILNAEFLEKGYHSKQIWEADKK